MTNYNPPKRTPAQRAVYGTALVLMLSFAAVELLPGCVKPADQAAAPQPDATAEPLDAAKAPEPKPASVVAPVEVEKKPMTTQGNLARKLPEKPENLPPIDAAAPEKTETATFAMG